MPVTTLSSSELISFGFLLFSVISLWLPLTYLWLGGFSLAVVFGFEAGVVSAIALVPIALLALGSLGIRSERSEKPAHALVSIALTTVALALGMHAFPGFHDPVILSQVRFSPDAVPYSQRLNFDKAIVGLFLLGFSSRPQLRSAREWGALLRTAAPYGAGTIAGVVAVACLLGYVRWELKWTALFLPWAAINLFFTVAAEEAFFRGLVQHELAKWFVSIRHGQFIALGAGAVTFGLAHFGGGATYVYLATLAGLGYGLVYLKTGRIEGAILTHFLLNAVHFLFFTYPRLA
ncbi:MAG: CPBP family intramembrane glutamic endopeptidase [Sulfuricaulis sp.]